MAENPDRKDKVHGDFAPSGGDLRFVLRDVTHDDPPEARKLRILQRWEWSYVDSRWAWYDVPLVEEKNEEAG